MRWVRANLRFGAWCALFALAVQFALTFGHVHVPGTNKALPALLIQLATPSAVAATGNAGQPAKPVKQVAHDQCAICASIHLANSLLPTVEPSFEWPADADPAWTAAHIDLRLAASPQNSFQARAPPIT
jgi:hypothetical protein